MLVSFVQTTKAFCREKRERENSLVFPLETCQKMGDGRTRFSVVAILGLFAQFQYIGMKRRVQTTGRIRAGRRSESVPANIGGPELPDVSEGGKHWRIGFGRVCV